MADKPESVRPTPARVGAGRPIPVREGVPVPPEASEPPAPSRTFRSPDGGGWEVEVVGRARTGRRGEPGATLLLLVFRPGGDEPGDGGAVEVLAPAEALEDLDDAALDALRTRGRPFRADAPSAGFFADTRRRGRRE